MGNVYSLPRAKNGMETVLEDLLCLAHINPITGLIVIAQFPNEDPRIGIAGRFLCSEDDLLAAIQKLGDKEVWRKPPKGPI